MKDAIMHQDLLAAVKRYQELFAETDRDGDGDDIEDLMECVDNLVQLMAREIVIQRREARDGAR